MQFVHAPFWNSENLGKADRTILSEMHRQPARHQLNAHSQHKRSRPLPALNNQHENKGHRNGAEYVFGEKLISSPATIPTPLVHLLPSLYADFPDLLFPLGQHGSAVGQLGSTSGAMNPTEYVGKGEPETQVIRDVYDCGIEMTQPLEHSSSPQCPEKEGSTVSGSSAYDATLHVMNTKDHHYGQQDQAATGSTEGCNKEQLGPYDTKEKMLDGALTRLLWLRHNASVPEILNTPENFGGQSRYCAQLSQDLHSVHQLFGRPQPCVSSATTTTCVGVTPTPPDDGPLCLVSGTGTVSTVERFDCVCHTPLRVSLFICKQAVACLNQYHQVASHRRRTATRNGKEVCLIGSMAIHRSPVGDVRVHRGQRKRTTRTSPPVVARLATRPFFSTTITYTASATSPFARVRKAWTPAQSR
ncbi:uncharacterized protein [Dermacentor albipictus]|uniref:uncharacterized protein n=1 Tax=Dermacentor albipictus TaxID=60249 RepID=UPI0038FC0665